MWIHGDGYNIREWFLKLSKQASNFPPITKALGGFPHMFSAISLVKEHVIYLQRDLRYKLLWCGLRRVTGIKSLKPNNQEARAEELQIIKL